MLNHKRLLPAVLSLLLCFVFCSCVASTDDIAMKEPENYEATIKQDIAENYMIEGFIEISSESEDYFCPF